MKVVRQTEEYVNTFDGTGPLYMNVAFPASGRKMPMIVFMHGFSGAKHHLDAEVQCYAERGAFTMAPDMRGRGGSAGTKDSGGMEVLDIYMGVKHCLAKYGDRIDGDNICLWGYSGGGGNGFSCAVRFPDLFNQIGICFGMSDYGRWAKYSPGHGKEVIAQVGGTVEEMPYAYAARNAIPGAVNNGHTLIHLIWDEEEPVCPGFFHMDYFKAAADAGCLNVHCHESKTTHAKRFRHGYPSGMTDDGHESHLRWIQDNVLFPEISSGNSRPYELADTGKLNVRGFVWTRRFAVVVENAAGTLDLAYGLTTDEFDFTVTAFAAERPNLSILAFETAAAGLPRKIVLNGNEVIANKTFPGTLRADVEIPCEK